ncbi:MAG: hypothetical protein K0R38_7206 [Polyangiaceae bacterium]|nr:hypothetical protein [Polyangiaceae bacterium]
MLLGIGGVLTACSSESTDGDGKAGSGNASGSSSGGTSTGGTGSGRAGSTGVGSCTPGTVVCLDENTAQTCDVDTGLPTTLNCVEDLKEIGIASTGCVGDETEGDCDGDVSDPECLDGAIVFAICGQYTQDQFVGTYIDCFQDNNDRQTPVRCVAPFLDSSRMDADCEAAAIDCLGAMGAGGADGAGGAGDPNGAGGAGDPDGAGGAGSPGVGGASG